MPATESLMRGTWKIQDIQKGYFGNKSLISSFYGHLSFMLMKSKCDLSGWGGLGYLGYIKVSLSWLIKILFLGKLGQIYMRPEISL